MLWQQCLNLLENELSDQEINTWFRTLHGTQHGDVLVLLAPNTFVFQYITDNHLSRIIEIAQNSSESDSLQVILQIGSNEPQMENNDLTKSVTSNPTDISSAGTINQTVPQFTTAATSSTSSFTNTNSNTSFTNNLDTSFTFDNFVEGKSNQLAIASAKQVSDNPGISYNPLFIYGNSGLGKTHLMHAIGNQIKVNNAQANVVYLHSERFVNGMVTALRTNNIDQFKNFYRTVDALLIDDIQFFANKTRSVEEFFHTFNVLLEGQKQVILTSDNYPRDVEGIDDRLSSRLSSGLTIEIQPPDLETRVAILTKKAEEYHIDMPEESAFFIAKNFRSNVRDLEGALQRVVASLRLHQSTNVSLDFVHDALRDQLMSQNKSVTVDNIKKTVAQHFNIKTSDMDSKRRTRSITRPRQMAMALSKELTNHSLPEIGDYFGGRDHTTVLHACRKIKELRTEDTSLNENYRILERTLTR
ncbi:MAG: chromosomal replication initiator protein DnaA [Cocleimonas sp.]